ncbi:MAG: TonB-dependent receptor [Bacteroidota bacterium]|nr:TonB-dependent receptor [Bacteroidota bacterium]
MYKIVFAAFSDSYIVQNLFLKRILIGMFCLISISPAFSQNRRQTLFSIDGRIIDAQSGAPLEYSTASLFNKKDSSLVNGNVTDEDGKFIIEAPEGEFWLELKFISYVDRVLNNIIVDNSNINLGDIKLTSDTKTLSEVVVSAQKDQMELKLDKRVFNVAADLTNVGRNAAEILDNVPSVTVDLDGNVSLRGSSSVRILVDGKPSGLVGISSTDALRMLQGDLIERIEVVTNPPQDTMLRVWLELLTSFLKKINEMDLTVLLT